MKHLLTLALLLVGGNAMARNIVDRDRGYKALMRNVGAVRGGSAVKVGILSRNAGKDHGGVTVLDIAIVHEFGLGDNPERSFIRAWVDENQTEVRKRLRAIATRVMFKGADPDTEMQRFGIWAVAQIKNRIVSHIAPPLAPATVARKGSDTPLVDTGVMLSSIASEVVTFLEAA